MIPPVRSTKAPAPETEKGIALAPSAKDLNPWYSDHNHEKNKELEDDRRYVDACLAPRFFIWAQSTWRWCNRYINIFPVYGRWRDIARKSVQDPLTFVNQQLASRSSGSVSTRRDRNPVTTATTTAAAAIQSSSSSLSSSSQAVTSRGPNEVEARLNRESSERQRALELIRRKKRELEGSETPSTVYGDGMEKGGGYADVFNRKEVEEAHKHREYRWERDHRIGNRHSHSHCHVRR